LGGRLKPQPKLVMAHHPGPRETRPECKFRVGHLGEARSLVEIWRGVTWVARFRGP